MARIAMLFGLTRRPTCEHELEHMRRVRRAELRALLAEIADQRPSPAVDAAALASA